MKITLNSKFAACPTLIPAIKRAAKGKSFYHADCSASSRRGTFAQEVTIEAGQAYLRLINGTVEKIADIAP